MTTIIIFTRLRGVPPKFGIFVPKEVFSVIPSNIVEKKITKNIKIIGAVLAHYLFCMRKEMSKSPLPVEKGFRWF